MSMDWKTLGLALGLAACALPLAARPARAQSPAAGPNLKNPASRFDGTWSKNGTSLRFALDAPMTAEARKKFDNLRPQDDPSARCIEQGTGKMMLSPSPMQIVAMDNHVLVVGEYYHSVRRIWTDTKQHDPDADPSYYGDSVVHWDHDTMVVDTVNYNGVQNLDAFGHPQSTAMHMTERWRMKGKDTLEIGFIFDDPKNYTKPWGGVVTYSRKSAWRLAEMSCEDNNRNNPDDPNANKDFTSTDKPAPYFEIPPAPGR